MIRTRTARLVLALSLVAVAGSACSSKTKDASANTVEMRLIALHRDRLTITAGDTVAWHQTDAGFHTVTSGTAQQDGGGVTTAPDGRFDSGQIGTGKTFEHTFADAGVYPYFCAIHPATMRGQITVN